MRLVSIIVAVDEEGGFGKEGKIPWDFKEDMNHFKEVTKGAICIMGRRTYEDMVEMRKGKQIGKSILPGRTCFVVTSNPDYDAKGAQAVASMRYAIEGLEESDQREIFVIGGEKMYIEALAWSNKIYMTVIKGIYKCDRFFPIKTLPKDYKIDSGEELDNMYFVRYIRT